MSDQNVIPTSNTSTLEEATPTRVFKEYVIPPYEKMRELYTIEKAPKDNGAGAWNSTRVAIMKNNPDGSKTLVHEFERNYPSAEFEPFRQLKDGKWHHYALISPKYTRLSVIDLETGEIINEPWPTITEKHHKKTTSWAGHEKWCEEHPIGMEMPSWGFCPMDFFVTDIVDYLEAENEEEYYALINQFVTHNGKVHWLEDEKNLMRYTGKLGFYSGCVWGDDSSAKLRVVNLADISEGVVTTDDRFGYIELAGDLKDIRFDETGRVSIPAVLNADVNTGKSRRIEAKWDEEDD